MSRLRIGLMLMALGVINTLMLGIGIQVGADMGADAKQVEMEELRSIELTHIECAVRAGERGFIHFYVEQELDGAGSTCWAEYRHPFNGQVLKVEMYQGNAYSNKESLYKFISGGV